MSSTVPDNETRTRVLDAAEGLFAARGFASVKLRDIAGAVGIHHASLYYYAPGGKEQLFIEVMERHFRHHHTGVDAAIREAGENATLTEQLHAVAHYIAMQPPMDMSRIIQADMPAINPAEAHRLTALAYDAIRLPIVAALERARERGEIALDDLDMAAMALVSLVQSVHGIPSLHKPAGRRRVARQLTDLLLSGLLKR